MTITEKPLSKPEADRIITLVESKDFRSLTQILEHRILKLEAESANHLAALTDPSAAEARASAEEAQSIRRFLKLVDEIRDRKNLNLVSISPNTTT